MHLTHTYLVRRSLLVAGVAAGLLAACGSDKPAGSAADAPATVEVRLTENGCEPAALTAGPGRTTFHVTNEGAAGVTEFEILSGTKVIGEVENVAAGLDRSFTVNLASGSYVTYCPGGKTEKGTLEVTG